MEESKYILEIKGIKKAFGGIYALKGVDMQIERGTCHAVVGENGAGKSTLMNILTGVIKKDEGELRINGEATEIASIIDAEEKKIAIVPQELSYVSYFTVAENIMLGSEPTKAGTGLIDWKKIFTDCEKMLSDLNIDLPARAKASDLSVSELQMIVIARVLSKDAQIIIMDEPTARLGEAEVEKLLDYIEFLKKQGKTIIYISHRLEEIFRICDHVTVLRDGQTVGNCAVADVDTDKLIEMMVNRKVATQPVYREEKNGETMLAVSNLNKSHVLHDVSFYVQKGEIVGLFGLVGAGRTEAIRAILGVDKYDSADITLEGKSVKFKNIAEAFNAGIVLVPEERRKQGALLGHSISENIVLPNLKEFSKSGILNLKRSKKYAEDGAQKLKIACSSVEQKVGNLSGGNQQKVVIAKFINRDNKVFILDEPTRGIDVGAKEQIYSIIEDLAGKGMAVIVISSEIPELQGLCDRIYVMSGGRIMAELKREQFLQSTNILKNALG